MKSKEEKYKEKNKTERASGDLLLYFITHNIISGLLFFLATLVYGIYNLQLEVYGLDWFQTLLYMFSSEFWGIVLQAIVLLFICSGIGRITAFYAIRFYHRYWKNRSTKKWSELNGGINRLGIRWFITTTITAVIYCVGVVSWLSKVVFNETTLLPLLIMYILVKVAVYFFVRWFVGSKT